MKIILILLIIAPITLQIDPENLGRRFDVQNSKQFNEIIRSVYL
jgi:hypothetical protein